MPDRMPFDEQFRCTATSRSTGERCRRRSYPGSSVCRAHGAGSPAVRAAADRRLQREHLDGELGKLLEGLEGAASQRHPVDVLLDSLHRASAMAQVLGALVGALSADGTAPGGQGDTGATGGRARARAADGRLWGPDHLGDGRPHVLTIMYGDWLDRAAKLSKLALDAGVEERQVRLVEEQAHTLTTVMRSVAAAFVANLGASLAAAGVDPRDALRNLQDQVPKLIAEELVAVGDAHHAQQHRPDLVESRRLRLAGGKA